MPQCQLVVPHLCQWWCNNHRVHHSPDASQCHHPLDVWLPHLVCLNFLLDVHRCHRVVLSTPYRLQCSLVALVNELVLKHVASEAAARNIQRNTNEKIQINIFVTYFVVFFLTNLTWKSSFAMERELWVCIVYSNVNGWFIFLMKYTVKHEN